METEHTLYYICKYTPLELLEGFGAHPEAWNEMPTGFGRSEQLLGSNICGFGKALLDACLSGQIHELVLTSCCDTIRSVADVLRAEGTLDFLYLLDVPHREDDCSVNRFAGELRRLTDAYAAYSGRTFSRERFLAALRNSAGAATEGSRRGDSSVLPGQTSGPYLSVLGGRMGDQLFAQTAEAMPLPLANHTCVAGRALPAGFLSGLPAVASPDASAENPLTETLPSTDGQKPDAGTASTASVSADDALLRWYAGVLLRQLPCMRMVDRTGRKPLFNDPNLRGIVYHTIRFCDYYSFEYSEVKNHPDIPLLKIETDYTRSSGGQLQTRLEAFAEEIRSTEAARRHQAGQNAAGAKTCPASSRTADDALRPFSVPGGVAAVHGSAASPAGTADQSRTQTAYFSGIDSGSTSTDVVILDGSGRIIGRTVIPTGAGARISADRALQQALRETNLRREDIRRVVSTGYGRAAIQDSDQSITEITCHAKGAHYLDPSVRCVIDIGGQDSKVIVLDGDGRVTGFVMNDKCAAGTGRFLEMMARTMEMSLDEMSRHGLKYREDITISSTCTVFAESEVVSLIAENKDTDDIVHGLDKAVASKTASLVARAGGSAPFMMTGGVAKNEGLVRALTKELKSAPIISDMAQLCGALGAALYAAEL